MAARIYRLQLVQSFSELICHYEQELWMGGVRCYINLPVKDILSIQNEVIGY